MTRRNPLLGRMLATLVGVSILNLVLVAVLVGLLSPWIGIVLDGVGYSLGPRGWLAFWIVSAVLGLCALAWLQLRYAHRRLLGAVHGIEVTPQSHPDLAKRVRRLSAMADLPTPRLVVSPDEAPNSFAVGRPGSGTVVVTQGLLDRLSGDQLDAVLAHELAHLQNRDAAVMTLVSLLPATLAGEVPFFRWTPTRWTTTEWVLAGYAVATVLCTAIVLGPVPAVTLVALVVAVALGSVFLGVFVAPALVLGYRLSWDREFVADRAAARLTGDPTALATAIEDLSEAATRPSADSRTHHSQLRPLCFLPFDDSENADEVPVDAPTHPPAEHRLERLRSVTAEIAT